MDEEDEIRDKAMFYIETIQSTQHSVFQETMPLT